MCLSSLGFRASGIRKKVGATSQELEFAACCSEDLKHNLGTSRLRV